MEKAVSNLGMRNESGWSGDSYSEGALCRMPGVAYQEMHPVWDNKLFVVCQTCWPSPTSDDSLRMNEVIRGDWRRHIMTMTPLAGHRRTAVFGEVFF